VSDTVSLLHLSNSIHLLEEVLVLAYCSGSVSVSLESWRLDRGMLRVTDYVSESDFNHRRPPTSSRRRNIWLSWMEILVPVNMLELR
jgi:hypothetical protein